MIAQTGLDHTSRWDRSMLPLAYGGSGIATGIDGIIEATLELFRNS